MGTILKYRTHFFSLINSNFWNFHTFKNTPWKFENQQIEKHKIWRLTNLKIMLQNYTKGSMK
jgi:hypothetical protein